MKMMRQILFLFALTIFLASCINSQTKNIKPQLTGDIKSDLSSLIPKGSHTVEIMDGVSENPRQKALTLKFREAINRNYEWFVEYMKTVPEGKPMPYHSNLGLTKQEYEELMGYMNNVEVLSTGKEVITIEYKGDIIVFNSQGKLSAFDSLKIDTKTNSVFFGQYKMMFSDSVNVKDDKNGLRSQWKGYTWKFEMPGDLGPDDLKDLRNLKMKQYELTVGRLEKNDKTYLSLKGREIENGAKLVDFELPVIF